jgi:hypothetical protein
MKRNTPLITLLTGAGLGIVLLIASMLATPKAPASSAATTTPAPASSVSTPPSPSSPAPATTAAANAPVKANFAGEVHGGGASVAISVHRGQVIAYVCNGSVIEAWLKGTASGGRLIMTGKNHARLTATYDSKKTVGHVVAHGIHYRFAAPAVHKPSGLYESIANVAGAKIKAGWIVLPDGTQVGSLESNADAAAPSATRAPMLDVATGTAKDGSTVLVATPVNGVTGSGF